MYYDELKQEIQKNMQELAQNLESFCVINNKEYKQDYKKQLQELHNLLEELLNI